MNLKNSNTAWRDRFGGIERLYGMSRREALQHAHVVIVGLGGVGSWTAEALARSGVGHLTLVDLDEICVTNTNRQIHAVSATVGQSKVRVMAERVRLISPEAQVDVVEDFLTPDNADALLNVGANVVVDAIDSFRDKVALIEASLRLETPVVCAGAAGGRADPTQIRVADLNRTSNDPLLRRVRRELRSGVFQHRRDRKWKIPAIYSLESARFPQQDGSVCDRPDADAGVALDCGTGMGTATHITGTFGFFAAAEALKMLTQA